MTTYHHTHLQWLGLLLSMGCLACTEHTEVGYDTEVGFGYAL